MAIMRHLSGYQVPPCKNLHSGRNHFINVYSGVVHSAGVANVVCAAHPNLALEHVKIDPMHANIGSDAIAVTIIM
mgnify:CR=1 FL=1